MKASTTRFSPQSGLTLIEIAMALGILSLILLGVFSSLGSAMVVEAGTREHQAASEAALRELDLQMSVPAANIALVTALEANPKEFHVQYKTGKTTGAGVPVTANLPAASTPINVDDAATATINESEMAGRVEVDDDIDGDGQVNLIEIRVTVKWRSRTGKDGGEDARVDLSTRRVVAN